MKKRVPQELEDAIRSLPLSRAGHALRAVVPGGALRQALEAKVGMTQEFVSFQDVSKWFWRRQVLKTLTLEIPRGQKDRRPERIRKIDAAAHPHELEGIEAGSVRVDQHYLWRGNKESTEKASEPETIAAR